MLPSVGDGLGSGITAHVGSVGGNQRVTKARFGIAREFRERLDLRLGVQHNQFLEVDLNPRVRDDLFHYQPLKPDTSHFYDVAMETT
jgi:hypothetical protein